MDLDSSNHHDTAKMPMSGPEDGQNQERTVDHLFDDDVDAELMDIDDPVDQEVQEDEPMKTYFHLVHPY